MKKGTVALLLLFFKLFNYLKKLYSFSKRFLLLKLHFFCKGYMILNFAVLLPNDNNHRIKQPEQH